MAVCAIKIKSYDKCPYLIDRCSSLSVIPKILVQSCESVFEQPCLGVLEFERNGHGSGDNVPHSQSEEQEGQSWHLPSNIIHVHQLENKYFKGIR